MPLDEAAADAGTGIARLGHEVHGAQQDRALRGISVNQRLRAVGVEDLVVLMVGGVEVVGDRLPRGRNGPVTYGFGCRGVYLLYDAHFGVRCEFVGRLLLLRRRGRGALVVMFFFLAR